MKYSLIIILTFVSRIIGQSISTEKIIFTSANPFSFKDIITDLDNQESEEVFGNLTFPENASEKDSTIYPLIIGVAGSLGWAKHHYDYLKMYREMGIATFELNSFKSRGISSTVGSQVSVTTAMMILDSYRAFEILSKHPQINADKVAITGWSLGGAVTLFSSWIPLKNAINKELKFAAHLAFYPPCFVSPEILDFTDSPIYILIGEVDNWTPAAACEELVPEMQKEGFDIGLTVYKNSHHSFDREGQIEFIESGYSFTDCRLKMRGDGAILMNFLSIPMTTPFLQKIGLAFCTERGVRYGGNPETKEKAFQFAREFMNRNLLIGSTP